MISSSMRQSLPSAVGKRLGSTAARGEDENKATSPEDQYTAKKEHISKQGFYFNQRKDAKHLRSLKAVLCASFP